jgi:signal transduction histidine kinase
MPTRSIRKRLVWTVILSQTILAAGLVVTGVFYTYRQLLASLDSDLRARAMSVAALVRYPEDNTDKLIFESSLVPPPSDSAHGDFYRISADGIGVVARSSNWPQALAVPVAQQHWKFDISGVPYRGVHLRNVPVLDREESPVSGPSQLDVVYAVPTTEMRERVWVAGLSIALASILLLGGTVAVALWGVRRGLLPLQHLASEAAHVSAQNWDFHTPGDAELVTELAPLTGAMKSMIDRLHQSFLQQREFLGNAAHELKTPVAVLKSSIQSLLQRPRTSNEYRAGLMQGVEDVERLEKLLRWMLRLARAEQWAYGTLDRKLEPIDIRMTCQGAIDAIRGLANARNTTIQFHDTAPVISRADPEDLELVWVNLLENAVRYSPEGSTVNVAISANGGKRAQIVVADPGVGIPQEELTQIFERFHRVDPSRNRETGGFGLGLAIAKALVEAYGGTIVAQSEIGQGTRMIVELPLQN